MNSMSPIVVGVLVLLFLTPALGVLVAQTDTIISLGLVLGLVVFIASFADTKIALYVLIFATLLSPEFGERSTAGGGVTLRLDDFLLLVIAFGQLAKAAVNRDVGPFTWTPLNKYITWYTLVCVFATGFGMVAGRVRLLTGFFFVLKYFEYFIVYFMVANNLTSVSQAKRFLIAMLATGAIVLLTAVAQIPGGGRVVAPFEGDSDEPNTLGGYLILIEAVIGGLLLTRDPSRSGGTGSGWLAYSAFYIHTTSFHAVTSELAGGHPCLCDAAGTCRKKLILSLVTISVLMWRPISCRKRSKKDCSTQLKSRAIRGPDLSRRKSVVSLLTPLPQRELDPGQKRWMIL